MQVTCTSRFLVCVTKDWQAARRLPLDTARVIIQLAPSRTREFFLSDPLALLPFACAAHGGQVSDHPARDLVAAGVTLLTRSPQLVRALAGRRSALLLPNGSAFLVALSASEGRGAVLINPRSAPLEIANQLADANVGAVFTTAALAKGLPPDLTHVLLDDAPRYARVIADTEHRDVDLGAHFGLTLEGDPDVPGSDEEAVIVYTPASSGSRLATVLTQRVLLHNARTAAAATGMGPSDRVLAVLPFTEQFALTVTMIAPLLAGAHIEPAGGLEPERVAQRLRSGEITLFAGVHETYLALLEELDRQGGAKLPPALRLCICGGPLNTELKDRWEERTRAKLIFT